MNKKLREWFETAHGEWAHFNGMCAVSLDKCHTIIGERVSFAGHDCVIVDANTDDVCPYVCLMPTYKNTSLDDETHSCVHIFFTDYKKVKEGMNKINKQIMKETTTAKFKEGDKVLRVDHPEWGVGMIWDGTPYGNDGDVYYKVEFSDAPKGSVPAGIMNQEYLIPYVPEPKFKNGDKVTCNWIDGVWTINRTYILKDMHGVYGVTYVGRKEGFHKEATLREETLTLYQESSNQPIGATPEHRWIDNRIMELSKAIHDHIDRGQKVPRVWMEELSRHVETFNNR